MTIKKELIDQLLADCINSAKIMRETRLLKQLTM